MQTSVKKQLILVLVGCIILTLGFGLILSVAINLSLQELEQRQDLDILPTNESREPTQPF